MSSSYRLELNKYLSNLIIDADSVLDIGGAQESIIKRVAKWNVNKYVIADLDTPHADSPKPDVVLDLNYEDYDVEDTYDVIFCLEVFDYVWNTTAAFDNIARRLKPKGTAYISFPFMYPTHNPVEDDALRYTEHGIRKLAEYSGLTIRSLYGRRPETNAVENLWRAERMRAAKHYDHNVTGWIVELTK